MAHKAINGKFRTSEISQPTTRTRQDTAKRAGGYATSSSIPPFLPPSLRNPQRGPPRFEGPRPATAVLFRNAVTQGDCFRVRCASTP